MLAAAEHDSPSTSTTTTETASGSVGDPGDAIPPIGANAIPVEEEELDALAAQLTALAPRLTQAQRTRFTTILRHATNEGGSHPSQDGSPLVPLLLYGPAPADDAVNGGADGGESDATGIGCAAPHD